MYSNICIAVTGILRPIPLLSRTRLCVEIESLPPAYIVRQEGNVLTRVCLSVHRGVHSAPGGGVTQPGGWGWGSLSRGLGVSPGGGQLGGGGQPHYTAGSMPLAFTQEDFLVVNEFGYLLYTGHF